MELVYLCLELTSYDRRALHQIVHWHNDQSYRKYCPFVVALTLILVSFIHLKSIC